MLLKQKLALIAAAKQRIKDAEEKVFIPFQPWEATVAAVDEFRAAHRALTIMKMNWRNAA
jgi:hypothetical protein